MPNTCDRLHCNDTIGRCVPHAARDYREAVQDHSEARKALTAALVQAQQEGASVQELMEWTGYSRRRVFQLLKEGKEKG